MPDDVRAPLPSSFQEFYRDLMWNLTASARIMVIKLPAFIAAASSPELATMLRDCLALTSHHHDALEAIVSRFDQPARVHAAELETLLGTAAREISYWSTGETRDLAQANTVRSAIYQAIPTCELAASLAGALGYSEHATELTRLRQDIAATDARLELLIRARVAGHRLGSPASVTPTVGESEGLDAAH